MFDFFANHTVLEGDYSLADITVDEQLGRGNAHVYKIHIKSKVCALKQIQIKNDYEYQNFLKQVMFMKDLSQKSEWFVNYYGYMLTKMQRNQYDKKKYAFIVMECAQINLEQFLAEKKDYKYRLKNNQIILIIQQLINALSQLEELQIAHCDIKPENILIIDWNSLKLKLCDVGSCKIVSKESLQEATILGTVPFLAPQLIQTKNSKISTKNPFKSDVYSFGLVVLYIVTYKKFKSHQRLQIQEQTYKQVIYQWIKQAKQLSDNDPIIFEIIKQSLQFDCFRRSQFKNLKFVLFNEKKKKSIIYQSFLQRMQKEEELKNNSKIMESTYYNTNATNQLSLFKTRKISDRMPFPKTFSNTNNGFIKTVSNSGNSFKISNSKGKTSLSPSKRSITSMSNNSNSPQKFQKMPSSTPSMKQIVDQMKKVFYISSSNIDYIPQIIQQEQNKNFVLAIPEILFKKAESITLLPTCTYDIFYKLQNVQCKRLYIESMDKDIVGVPLDAPMLNFSKIRMNLSRCDMVGGFQGLFRIITSCNLELLELWLIQTQIKIDQIYYLLDKLLNQCPNLQTFLLNLDRRLLSQEQHIQIIQKTSKLPVKKLTLLMNECYIQYINSNRWSLPKYCQILHLDFGNNLMKNIISNLSVSLGKTTCLKQLFLDFQNNALTKGEIHMLISTFSSIKSLQRLNLNFSYNKIQDIKYLQNKLLELLTINYLQIKLHKTEVQTSKIVQLVQSLKQLFEFHLKVLKISCDRNYPLMLFKEKIQYIIKKNQNKGNSLRCDVIGFDNQYFTVYIKKNQIKHQIKNKGGPAAKRSPKLQSSQHIKITPHNTMANFHSNPKSKQICYQLYTTNGSFNNYICLTCCALKEMNKYKYYCKFCLTQCQHKNLKDHYFVRVPQSTRCVCSYSGCCKSTKRPAICGDTMQASLKKEYQCLKCMMSFCQVCIQICEQMHKDWIRQSAQLSYFKCKSKLIPLAG